MTRRTRTDSPQHRRACTLSAMLARGTITEPEAEAGRRFAATWDAAQASSGIMRYEGTGTASHGAGVAGAEGKTGARRRLHESMRALGGYEAAGGRVIHHVIGKGETLREFAAWSGVNKDHAGAHLATGLGVLAGLFWPDKIRISPPLDETMAAD